MRPMNMIVVSAAKDSMRECRELTRVPAFLSEASIADVNEKAGGKIRDSDKTAKAGNGSRYTGDDELSQPSHRTRTTTTVGGGIAPFPVSHPSDCLGAR
jgi:hypothetical protein